MNNINNHKRDVYATHYRGDYVTGNTYEPFNQVTHNGLLALAKRITTQEPSLSATDWFIQGGSGSIPTPPVSGEVELISIDGVIQWDTRPYTVDTGTNDARFRGDVYAFGDFIGQQNTLRLKGTSVKSSNYVPFIKSDDGDRLWNIVLSKQTSELNGIPRYTNSYEFWDKNSTTGQFQPNQDRTLDFVSNTLFDPTDPTDPEKGYEYTFPIVIQAQGSLQVKNWYLRSATGFDNYYVKMYKGVVTDPTGLDPVWQSHSDKDIFEGNCFTAAASTLSDITFPLNNTYYQTDQEVYTFIGYSESLDQFEAGELTVLPFPPLDYPYVIADGFFVYDTPVFLPPLVVGTTENIESTQNMNNQTCYGIAKTMLQGDYNFTDILLFQNGLNNINQEAVLRVGIYKISTGDKIANGNIKLNNTTPGQSQVRVDFLDILRLEQNTSVYMCIAVNDYTSGGIVTFARTRSQNVNNANLVFTTTLSTSYFPANFSSLPSPSSTQVAINSFTNFDVGSIVPQNQSFMTVYD